MKIIIALLALILCLTGCGMAPSYETLSDTYIQQEAPEPLQILLELPEEAGVPTMRIESGDRIYLCDGYWISLQTYPSGDLTGTLRSATGYSAAALQPIQTSLDGMDCYDCAWSSAGEGQTQSGRLRLLDDGDYHYVVTVMADADRFGQLQPQIQTLFRSMRLEPQSFNLNTGS